MNHLGLTLLAHRLLMLHVSLIRTMDNETLKRHELSCVAFTSSTEEGINRVLVGVTRGQRSSERPS